MSDPNQPPYPPQPYPPASYPPYPQQGYPQQGYPQQAYAPADPHQPPPGYPPQGAYPPADAYQAQAPYPGQAYAPADPNQPQQPYPGAPGYPPGYGYDPAAAIGQSQAQRTNWAKWGGGAVLAVVALHFGLPLISGTSSSGGTAPACDAPAAEAKVIADLNDMYRQKGKPYTLVSLTNIVTLQASQAQNQCRALGTFSDNDTATVTYTLKPDGLEANVNQAAAKRL